MGPRVSLTIPILNAEKYLAEAIESVLEQTYSSWELLLVDDGSSDSSTEIAYSYQRKLPEKIHYLCHPGHRNLGICVSSGLGLRHSSGDYVARLGADDVLRPMAFEDQVNVLDAHPSAAMTYGPAELYESWAGGVDFLQLLSVPQDIPLPPPQVLLAFLRAGGDEPCFIFVRRRAMEKIGGWSGIKVYRELYEDIALAVKLCLRYPVIASSRSWYRYRQHPESLCAIARTNHEMETGLLSFLEWAAQYLAGNGEKDPVIWSTLENRMHSVYAQISPTDT